MSLFTKPSPSNILVFVPLCGSARNLVAESLLLARQLKAKVTLLRIDEDTTAVRQMMHSLYPKNFARNKTDLIIKDGDPVDLICQTASDINASLVIVGPVKGKDASLNPVNRNIASLMNRLCCSLLLFPQCKREGTRFRQIVCGIEYNDQSVEMLEFTNLLSRSCFSGKTHLVREYDHSKQQGSDSTHYQGLKNSWCESEKFLLEKFLSDIDDHHSPVETVIVEGQDNQGISNYASSIKADLLCIPAPQQEYSIWDSLLSTPLMNLIKALDCCLLLHKATMSKQSLPE